AAKLLEWIEKLPDDKKLLGRVTPIVEDSARKWIGIEFPWNWQNAAVYLQLLIDEINERTSYELKLQPWREYNEVKSRITFRKKPVRIDSIATQLCLIAAEQGKYLDSAEVRKTIDNILAGT